MEIKKDKFIKAAKERNYPYIDEYLKAKGNVNYTTALGTSALMWAVRNNDIEGADYVENIKLLLAAGADVNAKNKYKDTALIWAAVRGSYKIAKTLLEANADVNAKNNNGETALSMIRKHVNDHEDYAKVFYLLKSATEKGQNNYEKYSCF